jgi:glycosyltransferase involved in cell wall biosynthesis
MITVITPVYNGADFIQETVYSVLENSQNHEIEYIVVNDGSTDQTLEKLTTFGDRIKVFTKINGGESSAVNYGLQKAKGYLILIVSADDPLPSERIFEGAEEFFTKKPDVVAWYPNWKIIDEHGSLVREVEVDEYSDELLIGRFKCLPGPGTLIRTSAALAIGGRNEKWTFVGDYDFWLRLSRVGTLVKRRETLAQWRFHKGSTSIAKRGQDMAVERIAVIEDFLKANEIDKGLENQARAHAYYYAARLSFFDSRVHGKRLLREALKANRMKIEDGRLLVYLFIMTSPISRALVKPLKPILRLLGKALT